MPRKKVIPEDPALFEEEQPVSEEQTPPIVSENASNIELNEAHEATETVSDKGELEPVEPDDDTSDVHYISPEGSTEEEHHDTEIRTLSINTAVEEHILVTEKPRARFDLPWWAVVCIAVGIGLLLDSGLAWIGNTWYWSERLLYTVSLVLIFFLCLGTSLFQMRYQGKSAKECTIVNMVIALLIGSLLSINRFVHTTAFWTFFNLIGQPINALILSLAASWLGSKLFIKSSH